MLGPPGWGFDIRLKTLLRKRITVAKSKKVKTGSNLAEFSKEVYGSKSSVLSMVIMMMK
jgi:hypothetical protein